MPTKSWIEVPIDQEIEGVPTEGYDPFYFPPEGAKLVFEFTQESFLKVLSALINGAALTYPDEWIQVVWYFLRNVEYPVSLCDEIAAALLTCEDVQLALATLIATNEPIQESIREFVTSDAELTAWRNAVTGIVPETELGQNLGGVDDCDPDLLFNVCTVAVDLLNSISEDIFSIIELGTNSFERGNALFSAIPVVGAVLPIDEIMDFAEQLVSGFEEAYLAAYTETLEDELRCGLFCMAKDTCVLTIADMIGYYEEKLSHSLPQDPLEAIIDIFNFIATSELSGDTVVFATHLLVLASIRSAQGVLGFEFAQLAMRLVAAGDEPDNDWETLCEDCPPDGWEKIFDFRIEGYGWSFVGTRINDVGVQSTGSGGTPYTSQVAKEITWPVGTVLTRVRADVSSTTADAGAFRGVYYPTTAFDAQTGYTAETGDYQIDIVPNNPQPPIPAIQVSNASVPGVNVIKQIILNGTGTEPTW